MTYFTKAAGFMLASLMMTMIPGISDSMSVKANEKGQTVITEEGERGLSSGPHEPTAKAPTTPVSGIQIPKDALRTPDGGWVTIPFPRDENGNPINVKYEIGEKGIPTGERVPACRGPTQGLYQEGADWNIGANTQVMGTSEQWNMPTGTFTSGTQVGIYYNPANFVYAGGNPNNVYPFYNFFQVDFGLDRGGALSDGPGWEITYSYIDNTGHRQYPFTKMSSITNSPGSTYRVDAMLQPSPMSNPPAYVVQVTLGTNAWIASQPLGYAPNLGTANINTFQSFQDQWLLTAGGSSNYLSDTNKVPQLIRDVNNAEVFDSSLVTGMRSFDTINAGATTSNTRDILSPSPLNT